jgi:hypothetical protein
MDGVMNEPLTAIDQMMPVLMPALFLGLLPINRANPRCDAT